MKQDIQSSMKLVSVNVDLMQVFVVINNAGTKISVDMTVKNYWKVICDKGFIWNSSICECESDKLQDIGQYLDYKNCKSRKKNL